MPASISLPSPHSPLLSYSASFIFEARGAPHRSARLQCQVASQRQAGDRGQFFAPGGGDFAFGYFILASCSLLALASPAREGRACAPALFC